MNFNDAVDYVLMKEGFDSDDKLDRGGRTRYGISQAAYPSINMDELTLAQAKNIYHKDYWTPIKADRLPPPVAFFLFDMAVNQGVAAAAKTLQEASGALQDGKIGPATIAAVEIAYNRDPKGFLLSMAVKRARRYLSLNNESEERFEAGWISRLLETFSLALDGVQRK